VADLHVTPNNDLIEHVMDDACPCGPRDESVTRDDGSVAWIAVHHSLDGREQGEGSDR
jgi:hypothetical protein